MLFVFWQAHSLSLFGFERADESVAVWCDVGVQSITYLQTDLGRPRHSTRLVMTFDEEFHLPVDIHFLLFDGYFGRRGSSQAGFYPLGPRLTPKLLSLVFFTVSSLKRFNKMTLA